MVIRMKLLRGCRQLARVDALPVIVACYSLQKRLWYSAAPHIPRRWSLKRVLDSDSFAYELLIRDTEAVSPRKQSADTWFENDDAGEFEVLEQCVSGMPGKVLIIVYLSDNAMFDRGYDSDVRWRG